MEISEEFLMEQYGSDKGLDSLKRNPFVLSRTYSFWLKKRYASCQSEAYRERLQAEADRFSDLYNDYISRLFHTEGRPKR